MNDITCAVSCSMPAPARMEVKRTGGDGKGKEAIGRYQVCPNRPLTHNKGWKR